jgi:putative solute:sodium symporter small subunit
MPLTKKHKDYWHRNLIVTGAMLGLWFLVTFVTSYFARELNDFTFFGFPFGFYMGAQGSLIIYLLIIWYYARYMNRLDEEYSVHGADS